MDIYTCESVNDNCMNPDSYGEVCLWCNMCGRIDRKTVWQCRYDYYVEKEKEFIEKMTDEDYQTELQQSNIASDIIYLGRKIRECIKHLKWQNEVDRTTTGTR